jgi:hypothetical protein
MGVYKLSTAGGLKTPRTNYSSFLAGNPVFIDTAYESIATVTLSSSQSNIEFTSIPATYTHLQVRGIVRSGRSAKSDDIKITFNNDTTNVYAGHIISTLGSGITATSNSNAGAMFLYEGIPASTTTAGIFNGFVYDVLDYKNTNKFKTVKILSGMDANGDSKNILEYVSGLWRDTSAITSIKIEPRYGSTFVQYTQFALYGIKGA